MKKSFLIQLYHTHSQYYYYKLNYNNCKKYTIYIQDFSNYYNIHYFDEV